jgi:hypothetical protein
MLVLEPRTGEAPHRLARAGEPFVRSVTVSEVNATRAALLCERQQATLPQFSIYYDIKIHK